MDDGSILDEEWRDAVEDTVITHVRSDPLEQLQALQLGGQR